MSWSKYRYGQQDAHLKIQHLSDTAIQRKTLWAKYRALVKVHGGRARRDMQDDNDRLEAAIAYMEDRELHVTWHKPNPDVGSLYKLELVGKLFKYTWGRDRSDDPEGLSVIAQLVMQWAK